MYFDTITEYISLVTMEKLDDGRFRAYIRDTAGREELVTLHVDNDGMLSNSVYLRKRSAVGQVGVQWHGTFSEFLEEYCGWNKPFDLLDDCKLRILPANSVYAIEVV